jgi:hypothetical protein
MPLSGITTVIGKFGEPIRRFNQFLGAPKVVGLNAEI